MIYELVGHQNGKIQQLLTDILQAQGDALYSNKIMTVSNVVLFRDGQTILLSNVLVFKMPEGYATTPT